MMCEKMRIRRLPLLQDTWKSCCLSGNHVKAIKIVSHYQESGQSYEKDEISY